MSLTGLAGFLLAERGGNCFQKRGGLDRFRQCLKRAKLLGQRKDVKLLTKVNAGDGNHPGVGISPDKLSDHVEPALLGHIEVGDDQIERPLLVCQDAGLARLGFKHIMTGAFEKVTHDIPRNRIVIDDKNVRHYPATTAASAAATRTRMSNRTE